MRDVDRAARGLALRKVHPGLIHRTGVVAQAVTVPQDILTAVGDIAATMAAGLGAGLY